MATMGNPKLYVGGDLLFDNGSNMEHDDFWVGGSLEIEYRVYDADGELYAAASREEDARGYMVDAGDYLMVAYTIEERI